MPENTQPLKFSSRDRTELLKHGLPGGFLFMSIFLLFGAISEPNTSAWGFFAFFLICFLIVAAWTRSIKFVTLENGHFLISNLRETISVPISHLCRVEANRDTKTPSIVLHFSPTTAFGNRVRIIPPNKLFNSDDFERTVAILFDTVVANGYHPTALPVQRLKGPLH
jgi:hypothetical protein